MSPFYLKVRSFLQLFSFVQNERLSSVAPLSSCCLNAFQPQFYLSWLLCKQNGSVTSRRECCMVLGGGRLLSVSNASTFWPMHGSGFRPREMKLTMAPQFHPLVICDRSTPLEVIVFPELLLGRASFYGRRKYTA